MEGTPTNDRKRTRETPTMKTLFRWLGSDNPEQISESSGLLLEMGPAELPGFVHESLNRRRSMKFRVRMLAVIERMAYPLPPELWLYMFFRLDENDPPEIQLMIGGVFKMHDRESSKRQRRLNQLAVDVSVNGATIEIRNLAIDA